MKAYTKDVLRAVRKGKKRFFSIMLIAALGVTTMTGLRASCEDLRYTADRFYDISVVSTLGLTDDDVHALKELDGIKDAEGAYSEKVYVETDGKRQSVMLKGLSEKGINEPFVVEGKLPQGEKEIAVNERYVSNTGKTIGDTVVIEEEIEESKNDEGDDEFFTETEEEETANFINNTFTITAVVVDPADVNKGEGASSFRSSSNADYTFFVTPKAINSDIYTAVYLTLTDTAGMQCYSAEYEERVKQVTDVIEAQIKSSREQARYNQVTGEAYEKLYDAETEMNDSFAKADAEFAKAWREIKDGAVRIDNGERELKEKEREAKTQFAAARQEISKGYEDIERGKDELKQSETRVTSGEAELQKAKDELKRTQQETYDMLSSSKSKLAHTKEDADTEYKKLNKQSEEISLMFGSAFPSDGWKRLIAAAKDAYLPVIKAQGQISALGQQLALLDKASSEYKELSLKLEREKASLKQAEKQAAKTAAAAGQTFSREFLPVLGAAKQGIDKQISALDKNAEDYNIQLSKLQAEKKQLEALELKAPQMGLVIGQLEASRAVLSSQIQDVDKQRLNAENSFSKARQEVETNEMQLKSARQAISAGTEQLSAGSVRLKAGEKELEAKEVSAYRQINDGKREIENGRMELEKGKRELIDKEYDYNEKRETAEQKLADAKKEIEDIDTAKWYVQDRSSLGGYSNVKSDSSSIEALGKVFPVVFLVVAILISLTTITRMVEEERGLIGTYKALGFSDREIRKKYLLYAFAASAAGGILGDILGFVLLPKIIFMIFDTMYALPVYLIKFDFVYGTIGILLFIVCITGATVIACSAELRQMPAKLMRPKAPKLGSRVFLERITFVWNSFSFLNKVTARNLFRYKKRLFMTVAGIMGCTALLVCGFAIKDSVTELIPKQYEQLYMYDLMAVADAKDNDKLVNTLDNDENIESYINVRIDSVGIKNSRGDEDTIQMIVIPKGVSLKGYINLEDTAGKSIVPDDSGVYVTQNISRILGIEKGDRIALKDMELTEASVSVNSIVNNYLGNKVYITQKAYEDAFGKYEANGVFARMSEVCLDHEAYAALLSEQEGVLSSMSVEGMKKEFESSFSLVNVAVYIIITLAAGLAFVVLFTLSTTNISERTRELATIKVLGFYNREVHSYVNKETIILTFIGILLGLPLGHVLGNMLTNALNMPSIHFAVTIFPLSYGISAAAALAFALIVELVTNRMLDRINPVEALKSVE